MNFFEFLAELSVNPLNAIVKFGFFVVSVIIAITVHEFAHAWSAYKLGDQTANFHKRLNLNPLNHLDPIGTLFIFLVGFGWGKPTPFNPWNLKNPRRDSAIISISGPISNFLMAAAAAILFHLVPEGLKFKYDFLAMFVQLNILLGLFNLVPISPLDGFKVVGGLLPRSMYPTWAQTEQNGYLLLLFLVFFARDILFGFIAIPGRFLLSLLLGGF